MKPAPLDRTTASIVVLFTAAIAGSGQYPSVGKPGMAASTVQVLPCVSLRTVKAPVGTSPQPQSQGSSQAPSFGLTTTREIGYMYLYGLDAVALYSVTFRITRGADHGPTELSDTAAVAA